MPFHLQIKMIERPDLMTETQEKKDSLADMQIESVEGPAL